MRKFSFAFALVFAACGTTESMTGDDDPPIDNPPPDRGFRIESPDIEIMPGQEITYCYYFRTPNTETMAVKQWKSNMTPGSHHMIMFTTGNNDKQPEGTVSTANCGLGGATGLNDAPIWTYAAQTPTAELQLPTDDGTGKPLAQQIPANTAAFFQMHYLNATDAPIQAHVVLDAFALEADAEFTQTAAFVTYNASINIPPATNNHVETKSCTAPQGAKFWLMSTHAHKQAVHTAVKDGTDVVFESDDWEHPGAEAFMTPTEFYTFSNKVTYECTYNNPGSDPIRSGDSAATDEMCMASGYFFPATRALFCIDNLGPF